MLIAWISYDDVAKNYKVTYVAGGAAQNSARGAAVCRTVQSAHPN